MTSQLRHEIDAATFSFDLDSLADLLCEHENDDDAVACLYEAIDHVSQGLALKIDLDAVYTIS